MFSELTDIHRAAQPQHGETQNKSHKHIDSVTERGIPEGGHQVRGFRRRSGHKLGNTDSPESAAVKEDGTSESRDDTVLRGIHNLFQSVRHNKVNQASVSCFATQQAGVLHGATGEESPPQSVLVRKMIPLAAHCH